MIYLDNNASTQLLLDVQKAIWDLLSSDFGNPSSPHSYGTYARSVIEDARIKVAALLNSDPYHLIFTSSGSEANNMVLKTLLEEEGSTLLVSSVEHSSIRKTCDFLLSHGVKIKTISVDRSGIIDLDLLAKELKNGISLVSIQWVNNETGVIQPLEEIIKLCRLYNVRIHTDAAQALGKLELDVKNLDVDFLSVTGHKLHALQGVGAVYAKHMNSLVRMIHSGYEEYELRGGTENVIGILSFGKAAELRSQKIEKVNSSIKRMRDEFEQRLCERFPEICINGSVYSRVSNTTNLMFPEIDGRALMAQLDREGLICSQTSACTTQIPEPSHVLTAMGLSVSEAFSSLRFSFSELNTHEDVGVAVDIVSNIYSKLKLMKEFF